MSDCVFCRIAAGEVQGLRVFEDEKTLAFMDPHAHGHIFGTLTKTEPAATSADIKSGSRK